MFYKKNLLQDFIKKDFGSTLRITIEKHRLLAVPTALVKNSVEKRIRGLTWHMHGPHWSQEMYEISLGIC